MGSQITSLSIVYSTVYSGADQNKHQSSASLAFVWGIHRGPVNSPHKWPVTRKMFPFDDVIMHAGITANPSWLHPYPSGSLHRPFSVFYQLSICMQETWQPMKAKTVREQGICIRQHSTPTTHQAIKVNPPGDRGNRGTFQQKDRLPI